MLGLCAKAGLVESGVVAIDGTKMHANASRDANVDYDRIAREIIAEAIATDEAEDERTGTRAVMSCRRSLRPRRAGGSGWRESLAGRARAERTDDDATAEQEPTGSRV